MEGQLWLPHQAGWPDGDCRGDPIEQGLLAHLLQCPPPVLTLLNGTWKLSSLLRILSYCLAVAQGNCDRE